jgi:hypothetical protein
VYPEELRAVVELAAAERAVRQARAAARFWGWHELVDAYEADDAQAAQELVDTVLLLYTTEVPPED